MFHYKPYRCHKGQTARLDAQLAAAKPFGKIRLAQEGLFWKSGFHWHYIPLAGVQRIHRRRELHEGRLCAGGRTYITEWLMLILPDGSELPLPIGDQQEQKAIALMEELSRAHPEIPYGKV